jgi:riboflavin transporter FmnP
LNTKKLAAIVVFAALAIALNLSPMKIPAPFAPYLIYQIWEIPIVAAFLLFGAVVGVSIAVVNTVALFAFFPGALPTGPMYNLAAVLSMLLGIGLTKIALKNRFAANKTLVGSLYTASGMISRTIFMNIVNYSLLRFPPPIGYGFDEPTILATLPLVTIFNLTLALYTIPIGYSLARIIESSIMKSNLNLDQ